MKHTRRISQILFAFVLLALLAPSYGANDASITWQPWGTTPDGQQVKLFTLRNGNITATITTYGATITSLYVPAVNGKPIDVVLGYPSLDGYLKDNFGQTIGRYANRIAHGKFTLGGKTYQLQTNPPWPALHGGGTGFHMRVWKAESAYVDTDGPELVLSYDSPDGDQNFPGELKTTVTFLLNHFGYDNALVIHFYATTSKPTVVNLTEHTYFNLAGESSGDVLKQLLQINATKYTTTDSMLVPDGKLTSVAGTPLDFRSQTAIGTHLNDKFPILTYGHGYDLNYVLDGKSTLFDGERIYDAAHVLDDNNGINLYISTTQPGLQFYSGNWLNSSVPGVGGKYYHAHDGFALECQHFPDSPNHANFPSTLLKPGQHYHQMILYIFVPLESSIQ